jgi:hypothetical protein
LRLPNVIVDRYLKILAEMVALMMRLEVLMTTREVSVCEDEAERAIIAKFSFNVQ